jgi:hypothetical protein
MTEVVAVAQAVATFLAPFLPFLARATQQAAEEASKQLGAEAWKRARTIWMSLRPSLETHPEVKDAIESTARRPGVEPEELARHLATLLTAEPALAAALQAFVPKQSGSPTMTFVQGRGNQFAGPVSNSGTIIGGDSYQDRSRPPSGTDEAGLWPVRPPRKRRPDRR